VDPSVATNLVLAFMGESTSWTTAIATSDDRGDSWTQRVSGLADCSALAVDPGDSNTIYAALNSGLARSTDRGTTWQTVPSGCSVVRAVVVDQTDSSTLTIGGDACGVQRSTDGGATWAQLGTGLEEATVYALTTDLSDRALVHAGTVQGVFSRGPWVFRDSFESGDTGAWSSSTP